MNLFLPPKELPLDTKDSGSCYRNDEISHKSPAGKRRATKSLKMDYLKNDLIHSVLCLWVSFAHTTNLYYWKEALMTRKVTRNVFVFFLFVFNAKCLLVFEYWRLYYAHWTQRWLNQWDKKNHYVSLRIIEANRIGNRIIVKRVKIGILNGILILVPKGFLYETKVVSSNVCNTEFKIPWLLVLCVCLYFIGHKEAISKLNRSTVPREHCNIALHWVGRLNTQDLKLIVTLIRENSRGIYLNVDVNRRWQKLRINSSRLSR